MEGQEKELLIDKALQESDSQKDRNEIDSLRSLNLLTFIEKQIKKADSKDTLRSSVLSKLLNRINSQDADNDDLNNVELIKLLEILEKTDNDLTSIIFENMKDLSLANQKEKDKEGDFNITVEDMNIIKKYYKYVELLEGKES